MLHKHQAAESWRQTVGTKHSSLELRAVIHAQGVQPLLTAMRCLLLVKDRGTDHLLWAHLKVSHPINYAAFRKPGWQQLRPAYQYDCSGSSKAILHGHKYYCLNNKTPFYRKIMMRYIIYLQLVTMMGLESGSLASVPSLF